jgi:TonB family protein
MSSTMAARRYSMGPLPDPGLRRPGPALRRRRLPMAAIGFSAVGHIVVFGGLTAFVMWSGWRPQKVQVVNLVPMVAAVGTPSAPAAPTLPARPQAPVAPRAPEPEPKATTAPREAPRREAPSLPAPSLPAARPLPPRATLPRSGEKELPSLAAPSGAPRGEKTAESSRPPETASLGTPTGSVTGQGALTFDVSDFPYAWYLRQVNEKVSAQWQRQNQISEPQQKPQIYIEIQRDGTIRSPSIVKSSGNALYDRAALRAVMEASPFPPLPQDWSKPSLNIQFTFNLQRG